MNKLLNISCWKSLLLVLGVISVNQTNATVLNAFMIGNLNASKPAKFKLIGANGRDLVVSLFPGETCHVNDLSYLPRQKHEKTIIITDMNGQIESMVITQKTESIGVFNVVANGVKDFKASPFYVQDNDTKEWRAVGRSKISIRVNVEKTSIPVNLEEDHFIGIDNASSNPQFPSSANFLKRGVLSCEDKQTGFGNAKSPVVPSIIHANTPFWSSKAE